MVVDNDKLDYSMQCLHEGSEQLYYEYNYRTYLYRCLQDYRNIINSGSCNMCSKQKECIYLPKPGELVRYNCPFYKSVYDTDDENESNKSGNEET